VVSLVEGVHLESVFAYVRSFVDDSTAERQSVRRRRRTFRQRYDHRTTDVRRTRITMHALLTVVRTRREAV